MTDCSDMARNIVLWRRTPYVILRCNESRDAKSCVSQANNAYIFMVLLLLPCSDGLLVRREILRLYWLVRVGVMMLRGIA